MSEHPEVQWALDLLKPDPNHDHGFLKTYAADVVCVGTGVSVSCLRNWLNCRPLSAGIQIHIGMMAAGYVVAQFLKRAVDNYQAERDTRLRDYIVRHPEYFPEPERVKYKDVLQPWHPIR